MKKLRIALIGHKYVPSREGGVEVVVDNLSSHLAKMGHDVTIFNRKRKEYPLIEEYNGCKVENVFTVNSRSLDAIVYSYFATLKVSKMIKKGEIDVVHFHAEGPCYFLNLLPSKKRYNYRLIVTIHGLDWARGKWGGLASRVIKSGERKAVKYADEIIVLSMNTQKYFLDTYNRKTIYIPNGINPPVVLKPNIIKDKYGLNENSYILFLARIVPEKGLHYLLDAWKELKKEIGTPLKLVVAGSSSHSDEYYNSILEKINGDESIITTGFVEGEELYELYSNAYLYVLPSDLEGMPVSLLEAMSYGNVCLVSDIPENVEVINENCFVFEKGNVEKLKYQIKKIINLNLQNHKHLYNGFLWEDIVKKTVNAYLGEIKDEVSIG